jgi:hypothetical protein
MHVRGIYKLLTFALRCARSAFFASAKGSITQCAQAHTLPGRQDIAGFSLASF